MSSIIAATIMITAKSWTMKSEGDEPEVEKIGGNKESVDCKKELGFIDRQIDSAHSIK